MPAKHWASNQKGKHSAPYIILGIGHDQNLRFYERYDEHFLFNKVVSLLYIIDQGEPVIKQIEENLIAHGGTNLPKRYLESIRAEIFFTALHQCETFFALLIAPFQPLPHWLYLTTYENREIKQAVEQIITNDISSITDSEIVSMRDFIEFAVYNGVMASDLQLASHWDENINNVIWLVKRIGEFYLKYGGAYNSYKHGLRVMTGPHQLSVGLQAPDGVVRGPMKVLQASEDAVTYLQKEPAREVDGEKEIPISEIVKAFNPFEASFYLAKMIQMLETIRIVRLTALKGGGPIESINTFFELDKDKVLELEKRDELKYGPARADEARAYSQIIAQMQANAKRQADVVDPGNSPGSDGD